MKNISKEINNTFRCSINSSLWDLIWESLRGPLWNSLGISLESSLWISFGDSLGISLNTIENYEQYI